MSRLKILFTGVGGQGTLLASRILGEAAIEAGIEAISSEVHGMAQRGGVVETSLLLGGQKSPLISDGESDIMVSFEPLEAIRSLNKCSKKSIIITNTTPIMPFTVTLGMSQYPDIQNWIKFMQDNFKKVYAVDADSMAKECGSPKSVNILLLGILSGVGLLPLSMDVIKNAIKNRIKPNLYEANIKAFEKGIEVSKC
jgi:indolepyruvate ferredoxin oxidoreductase beta subunit